MLRAGCVEIFGTRSSDAASEAFAADEEGLNAEGDKVGRRGVIDVNVLYSMSIERGSVV